MFAQIFYAVAPSQDEKFPKTSPCLLPACAHRPLVAPPPPATSRTTERVTRKGRPFVKVAGLKLRITAASL